MFGFEFRNPEYLLLLIPFAAAVAYYYGRRRYRSESALAISSERILTRRRSVRALTYRYLSLLRFLTILLLIIGLARPGRGVDISSVKHHGIDIMIALDVSDSMMGEDFIPKNRLEVAKKVIKDFIGRRLSDRIGLVVFSGDAYLQCPLTIEHQMITAIVDEVGFDTVAEDGTAIGDAIALAASRMMDRKTKSRIVLLLTDGMNNRGSIDPETAARASADLGIRVYTVGIGKEGRVSYPSRGGIIFGKRYLTNHFDESGLQEIATITGGRFYRAQSSGVLWEKIEDIDRLERSEMTVRVYREFFDRFQFVMVLALSIFFCEVFLRSVFYRKVP